MTYSWIAASSYNTALQRMSYFVLAKTIERLLTRLAPYLSSGHGERSRTTSLGLSYEPKV
jgi:hypothetical protein